MKIIENFKIKIFIKKKFQYVNNRVRFKIKKNNCYPMNEKRLQKILSEFAHKRDWDQFHNLKNLAISINIESSELLEIFQWKKEEEIKLDLKKKQIKEKISDEIADIMLYLLRFSDLAKINIEKCCLEKIKKNEKKYPVSLSKGKSTKYNLLKK